MVAPERRTPAGSPVRARILEAASALFYADGIRATSADRIIERAGTTKVTFYRHFRTKGDLVVAYLEEQAANERAWMESIRHAGEPAAALHALAAGIGAASCSTGFRGCPFINAAAEHPEATDPVRVAVDVHRRWVFDQLAAIAADAGVEDVRPVARQMVILRDGAMVNGYLSDPEEIATVLEEAFSSIVGAGRLGG